MGSILENEETVPLFSESAKLSSREQIENFAAVALDMSPQQLRRNLGKSWLVLGGDSLTAVNFMGLCYESGIDVDIPSILRAQSLTSLIEGLAQHRQDPKLLKKHLNSTSDSLHESNYDPSSKTANEPIDDLQCVGPCSPMQENFLALQKVNPGAYQLQLEITVSATNPRNVNLALISRSWAAVVRRHGALRTTFRESTNHPGRLEQVVYKTIRPQISILSISEIKQKRTFQSYLTKFPHHLILAETPDGQVLIRLVISHAIADAASVEIVFRDLFKAITGTLPTNDDMESRDYMIAQQPDMSDETYSYWSRYTSGHQGSFLSSQGSKVKPETLFVVDQELELPYESVLAISERSNGTLVNVCQLAYALMLRCYTGSTDILFSYTASGRDKRVNGLQDAVGNFVNVLPCRTELNPRRTVADILERTHDDFLESLPYQSADLTSSGRTSGLPVRQLSDSLVSFQRGLPETKASRPGFAVDINSWEAPSDYPYTLSVSIDKQKVQLRLHAWESLTSKGDAARMVQVFCDAVTFVLNDPDRYCSEFTGLTEQDRRSIIRTNKDPYTLVQNCVHEQVLAVSKLHKDKVAICAWDGELTYAQLETSSSKLAAHFVHQGLKVEDKIGLCMDKSRWVPVAMLAILQAGGVVVPLGNDHPLQRVRSIVKNAGISVLVTDEANRRRLKDIAPDVITVDGPHLERLQSPAGNALPKVSPNNAAWIVHTSGSTGVPKGVVLEHETLCSPMHVQARRYGMSPATRALQFSAHTWDVVVKDIFTTLSFGGCVCIPSEHQRMDDLSTAIKDMEVNFASLTPTVASLLNPRDLLDLETLVLTGEAVKPSVLRPWLDEGRVRLWNGYGPAECAHVSSINGPITCPEDGPIIGFPAANRLWVVDLLDFNRLSPIGAIGELLIEGAIAREYLHDREKTDKSFVTDPGFIETLGLRPGRRMYRTGDLVKYLPDGTLLCFGRRDTQIKVRGQRVEVGEIESRISSSMPGNPSVFVDLVQFRGASLVVPILAAAVDMRKAGEANESIPRIMQEPSEGIIDLMRNLRSTLLDQIPAYMVPNHILPFAALPLNSSGKLDRQATRSILEGLFEEDLLSLAKKQREHVAISTRMEERLQAIWAEVFRRPLNEIGRNDHFLELGGDSVLAMRMAAIARTHNVSLSVAEILGAPRFADLAQLLEEHDEQVRLAVQKDPEAFELWQGFVAAAPEEQSRRLNIVAEQCKVPSSDIIDVYPVSPLMEGLMAMTSQSTGTYVAQNVFRMDASIDVEHFRAAWTAVVDALAVLRTRIVYTSDAGSVQVVLRHGPQWTSSSGISAFIKRDRASSFAYGTPLHRFAIVEEPHAVGKDDSTQRYFVWTAHHSAYDGYTVSRTFKLFTQVYQQGSCDAVTPIPRFIRFLEETNHREGGEKAATYWRRELETAQLMQFPERPSPSYRINASEVARHDFRIRSSSSDSSVHANRFPLSIILRAAWSLVVASHTGSTEAMLAVVLSGRDAPVLGIEDVVAPTITTVPCRILIDRSKSVLDWLTAIASQSQQMSMYAQYGLANIRRAVPGLPSDFHPAHLFHVQPASDNEASLAAEELGLEMLTGDRGNFEGFPLVVECTLSANGTSVHVELRYDEKILSHGRIRALMSQLDHVACALQHFNDGALETGADADQTVGQLDLISGEDKEKLLQWNQPPPPSVQTTMDNLIATQIVKSPERPAVCARDGNLTYHELDVAAERLAHHLVSLGVGPETYVALCMDKSMWAPVAMLAILRAGGAVVPLGVQYADARIETILIDANISVALVDAKQSIRFQRLVRHSVVVSSAIDLNRRSGSQQYAARTSRAEPNNPAWVIYTSGSTGIPKGVVLEHQAMCSSIAAHGSRYYFGPDTRTLQFSSFTFDVSLQDNMTTLSYGGCICMPSEDDRTDNLAATMKEMQITLATLTPTVISLLDPQSAPASLNTIILVGEAVKPAIAAPWIDRASVFNGYGPAESSIYSVINGPIRRAKDAPIIGSPVSNRLWVTSPLDYNSLVPLGTPGELLIEGPLLAREYLNDPKKTAKSFVVDPKFAASLSLGIGRRMYRTGDLVVQDRETGLLECLGRIDTQIKIRGQRVETGEIESHIVRLQPGIRHACVDLVRLADTPDPMLLVAIELSELLHAPPQGEGLANAATQALLPKAVHHPSPILKSILQAIRVSLQKILPLYMIPSHFIPMTLPVNASGKLDRRATKELLARITREHLRLFAIDRTDKDEDHTFSSTEESLRRLWAEVLNLPVEKITRKDDDFFELGGDSVAAMRLVAAAQREPSQLQLGVAQILTNPSLADMAQVSEQSDTYLKHATEADPAPFELWDDFLNQESSQQQDRLMTVEAQCHDLSGPSEIVDVYPTTPLQEGLMAITSQQGSAYVAQQVFRCRDIDIARLQKAWSILGEKLVMLRTRIVYTPQVSVQVVVKKSYASKWEYAQNLEEYLRTDRAKPFSYGSPLHRQAIVEDQKSTYFVWTGHHAAYDGWSMARVVRLLVQVYKAQEIGAFAPAPMSRFIKHLQQTNSDATRQFWKGQLEGAQLVRFPSLPSLQYQPKALDRVRAKVDQLKPRTTPANLARAAWALTVANYTGSTEAIINVSLSGRDTAVVGVGSIIGPTITTVPVRIRIDSNQSVAAFLTAVDQQAKDMVPFAHAGLQVIRRAVPGLDSGYDAGHLFIVQPAPTGEDDPGLRAIGLELDSSRVEHADFGGYALAVDCIIDGDSIEIDIRFDNNVISKANASALSAQFEHNIQQLNFHSPSGSLADLNPVNPADSRMICSWNSDVPATTFACIHGLIQKIARSHPNATAVDAWDGRMTYQALHDNATRLAHYLVHQHQIGPEITVGLCMDKSLYTIVAILAILMAGGVVVPIGNQQPLGRISIIAKDAGLTSILVDKRHCDRLAGLDTAVSNLITLDPSVIEGLPTIMNETPVCTTVTPHNAAWIVYTSGSTGVPKGIVLEHKALCSSFTAHGQRVGFSRNTRALQFSALTFDNCIEDILSVLSYGGCVCVPSEEQRMNLLSETIHSMNVNLINTTSTVASLISPTDVPMLETLLLGGETVSPAVVGQWLGHADIRNTYGPAECSVDVACSVPMKAPGDAYTIGDPLGVHFWVASPVDFNRLVPIGVPGELLIEGPHLGRGYLNDADKTARAFIQDPSFLSELGLSANRRMYRTGDLVKFNRDGSLIHLGRIDTQIKIRGQRVEVGEIESNIVRLQPVVRLACVDLIRPTGVNQPEILVAAIEVGDFGLCEDDLQGLPDLIPQSVRSSNEVLEGLIEQLRHQLSSILPRYMIPRFVPLTSLPLNTSSKLDRKATRGILEGQDSKYFLSPPLPNRSVDRALSPMEEQIRKLWVMVLNCDQQISPGDSFVQLGGDSVTAMRLVAAAQGVGIRIGVADILTNPRMVDMARIAENQSLPASVELDPAPFELWNGFDSASPDQNARMLFNLAERCQVASSDIEDVYPATPLQEAFMVMTAQQPGTFVAQDVFKLEDVDLPRFSAAWATLSDSLPILRTRLLYESSQSGTVQVVLRTPVEWSNGEALEEFLESDKATPFEWGTPLHRFAIVGTESSQHRYFVWTQHHSAYDGYQMGLILNLLAQTYQGSREALQALPPISRFIKFLQQSDKDKTRAFWKKELGDAHQIRFPPVPHPMYRPQANGVIRHQIKRGAPKTATLGVPVAVLLRVSWAIVVAAFTGSTESTSTMALSGRDIPMVAVGNLVAPTMTAVPVRTDLRDGSRRIHDVLQAAVHQSNEMRSYIHTGLQAVRATVPTLSSDYDPGHVFLVQPNIEAGDADPLHAIGLTEVVTDRSGFGGDALMVQCTINNDRERTVDIDMRYDTNALPEHMAHSLLSHFEHILQQIESNSDCPLDQLNLTGPDDVAKIRKWNNSIIQASPKQSCIHDLVDATAQRQPNAPAVMAWNGEMTYDTLTQAARQLSNLLISLGVGPEVKVGVSMSKSLFAMVSMLAILYAGGAVVGLSTQHPLSRIQTIAMDAELKVILTDAAEANRLSGISPVMVVDASLFGQLPRNFDRPRTSVTPNNAAWIVYTSGSTGTPKGVVLEHQTLCTGILGHGKLFGNSSSTRALQYASHTFGVAIEDFFTTVIFGGCVCIPSEEERMDIDRLSAAMRRMCVNFINMTSTAASLLDPHELPEIDTVVLGGEAVTPGVVSHWINHARILNAYGQSECCVESVIGRIDRYEDAMTIGFTFAGCAAWVVDAADHNRLLPIGAPGELLVQGPLLARGYLNDLEKTADSFVSTPAFLKTVGLESRYSDRLYRTRDLVKQNPDGSLVYLGRLDHQIQVHGQRVEPGEVETLILQLDSALTHVLVDLVNPTGADDAVLIAAVSGYKSEDEQNHNSSTLMMAEGEHNWPPSIKRPSQDLSARFQKIRAALLQHLPSYMVPGFFVPFEDSLPVNSSGKLDRKATRAMLSQLERSQFAAFMRTEKSFTRELTEIEGKIATAYAEVIGCRVEEISADDQFSQIGGDSIGAMRAAAVCRQNGLLVSVRDILLAPSISNLAAKSTTISAVATLDGSHGRLEESSNVTDVQEWILNLHVARPDVGRTWFALDARSPLQGDKLLNACRQLLSSIEILHTGFAVEGGKWKRVVISPFYPNVALHKIDCSLDGWTEEYIQRKGREPLISGQPLVDITVCETSKHGGQHRVLIHISHAIWDGVCISTIWETLKGLYMGTQPQSTASFSQYVAQVEKRETSEATEYWRDLLKDSAVTSVGSPNKDYVWRAAVLGSRKIPLGNQLPRGTTCANLVKSAWALVLARHTKKNDVVFADGVSGRAAVDGLVADAVGCCSTPMPVRVKLDPSDTYAELVYGVRQQHLESLPFETSGFKKIARDCTDWPDGTVPTSWLNHVPSRPVGFDLDFGDIKYSVSQPKQEEKNWTFSETRISWLNVDNALEYSLAYAVEKIPEPVAQCLYDDFAIVVGRILSAPHMTIAEQLID